MLHLSSTDIGLIVILGIFIVSEWRYRAKRDGAKHATGALVFAGIIFGVGTLGQSLFGIGGLVAVLVILMLLLAYTMFKRQKQSQL